MEGQVEQKTEWYYLEDTIEAEAERHRANRREFEAERLEAEKERESQVSALARFARCSSFV